MHQDLIKLPTDQLLTKFGSGSHKPGSGSAAALLGVLSCKLIQTVISLSFGRDQYKGVESQLTLANQNIVSAIEPLLTKAVEEDARQFDRVIQIRHQRDSEQDKTKRRQLSDKALSELRIATEIPIGIAEACLQLASEALVVFDLGFKSARGDAGVAISSALAGASGSISIVYLNLTSFKGSGWAVQIRQKTDELFRKVQALQIEVISRINRLQDEVLRREAQDGEVSISDVSRQLSSRIVIAQGSLK